MGDFLEMFRKAYEEGEHGSLSTDITPSGAVAGDTHGGSSPVYSDRREQAIIDSRMKNTGNKFLDAFSLAYQERQVENRRQQRAYAEQAPPEIVEPTKQMLASRGDRYKLLEILRKMTPEQRQEALRVAPGIGQQMGDDRGGGVGRAIGALSMGISQGVSQPIMELFGAGGTQEEIDFIRELDKVAAQEFNPALPSDPWYERGPLQAAEMLPWMATTVGAGGVGGMAGKAGGTLLARGAAAGVPGAKSAFQAAGAVGRLPAAIGLKGATTKGVFEGAGTIGGITAAAFPSMYSQEVEQLRELGMEDDWKLRLLAGGTALVGGAIEGLVPNPFGGTVSLKQGAMKAARQYLWESIKKAPVELSEEYMQGVTSGLGEHIAQYIASEKDVDFGDGEIVKSNGVKKKTIADAFAKGWEQAKEAALPMAFLLGVPAVGGAGRAARKARKYQLDQIKAKGFVSEEDAKEAGIEGANRRERMANLEAEVEQITQEMQNDPSPDAEIASMVDELPDDTGVADQQVADQSPFEEESGQPQVEAPLTPTPLYEVVGDENMVARVWPNREGFLVNLTDMDSGEVFPTANIFPTFEQARQYADTVRLPQQPQVAPPSSGNPFVEGEQQQGDSQQTPASFAARMARGEQMTSPEDLQYRLNNAAEIEAELQKLMSQAGSSSSQISGQQQPPVAQNPFDPEDSQPQGGIPDASAIRSPQEEVRQEEGGADLRGSGQEQVRTQPESQEPTAQAEVQVGDNTYRKIREILRPANREDLQVAIPYLQALYPEYANDANDPWGIGRAVQRGDELPRVPTADLSRRIRDAISAGVLNEAGDVVSREVPSQTEPQAERQPWESTRSEASSQGWGDNWSAVVRRAISQGKPVPQPILDELAAFDASKPSPKTREELPKAKVGDTVVRYAHKDGTGLLNNNGLDRSKLTDDEDAELIELMDFGLTQPPQGTSGTFYFTQAGEAKNARMLELLSKASKSGVVRTESKLKAEPTWQSDDGQIAVPDTAEDENAAMDEMVRAEFESQMRARQSAPSEKKGKKRKKPRSLKKPTSTEQARDSVRKRKADLYQQFKDEFKNKPPSGLDAKLAKIAVEIAIAEIEDGVLTFAAFVENVSTNFAADALDEIKPYFESAWRVAHSLDLTKDPGGKFDDVLKGKAEGGKEVAPRDKKPVEEEGKPAKPAPAESDTDKTLRQAGLKVEQLPDGTWQITGNTYENSKEIGDAKREVPDLKGWWDPRLKRWTFKRDPRREIADRIASRATRDEPVDDAGSDEQMAREDARREQDAIADIQRSGEDYVASVDQSTKDLVARGLKFGMTQEVVDNQIEDIGRVVVAAEENLPMFVIGSAPGTGKTFVLGGVIRELRRRGFKKFIYVTQNENLISQVQGNLADYGLDGVEFTTYAKSREKPLDTSGAVLLLDEAHTAKNDDRETGKKISRMVKASTFTVYATATPFENVSEAEYLGYSGIFDGLSVEFTRPSNNPNRPFRNTLSGFDAWAWMFGAKVFFVKQTDYKGDTYMVPVVWWDKHQTAEEDQFAANEWLKKRGVYVQRPMSLPAGTVKSEMRSVEADPYWADISNRVVDIYDEAESQSESNQEKGQIKAHKETVLKRLLELAKVDAAIARTKEIIGDGRKEDPQVIIFVNYKSDLDLGTFALSKPYRDHYKIKGKEAKRRYKPSEMDEMMRGWYQAKALAKQTGNDAGPPPFAPFIHKIAMVMDEAGLLENFPSVIDKIMDAFPGQAVEFSGRSGSENADNLAKWKNNEAKLIVATMHKGGTGLSFHDTTGKMPSRYQVNMTLPWSGTQVEQVSGRLARYGTAKPVNIEWIFANNIPFDRRLSKTVGSRMRSMSAAVQGTKSGDAKRIMDFDFTEDQQAEMESPWLNASVEDENRWAGTTVSVSPKGKQEGYQGTVVRVLNKGETIEIQRDGFDSSTRVPAERVSIISLVDDKAGTSTEQADKAAKILSDMESNQEKLRQDKKRREGEKLANWVKAFESSPREVTAAKDLFRKDAEKSRENGVSDERLFEIIDNGVAVGVFTPQEASDLKSRVNRELAGVEGVSPYSERSQESQQRRKEIGEAWSDMRSYYQLDPESTIEDGLRSMVDGFVSGGSKSPRITGNPDGKAYEYTGGDKRLNAIRKRAQTIANKTGAVQAIVVVDNKAKTSIPAHAVIVSSPGFVGSKYNSQDSKHFAWVNSLTKLYPEMIVDVIVPSEEKIGKKSVGASGLKPRDRFVDSDGQTWEVFSSRGGVVIAHPVVDGKPQVNRDSQVSFAVTDAAKSRHPEYKTDIVSVTKWKGDAAELAKKQRDERLDELEESRLFNENFIKIVADDVSKIRKQDVYRLLSEVPSEKFDSLKDWLQDNRPDLAKEIEDASIEIIEERATIEDAAGAEPTAVDQQQGEENEEEAKVDSGSEKGDERAEADKESAGRVVGGKTKVGKRAAHYEVVEWRTLIASHHPFGMAVNEDFPSEWQRYQRAYHTYSQAEKQEVWMPRDGFDVTQIIDTTRWHDRGPTMAIRKNGKLYVVGGTRRFMMLANQYRSFPDKGLEYHNALVAEADLFNFDANATSTINGMDEPVLIRVIDKPGDDIAKLIDELNADAGFEKDPAAEAASLGRGVSKNTIKVLREINDEETLAKFLDRKGVDVVYAMVSDNSELKTKIPGWVKNNSLTKDAKFAVQKAIMGAVIPDATLISQASPRILQSINGSLPEILSLNQKGGEWSLSERLKEAITYDAEFRSTGKASSDRNIDYWMNDPQMTFLEGFKKDPNSDGYRLWRYLLNYGGARKFRIALQKTMIKEARLDVEMGGLFAGLADPDVEPSMSGNEAFELLLRSGDIDGQAQQNLDDNLRNLPPPLYQTAPDVNENMWSEALNLSIAAQDAGIKSLRDFVAYSVKTIGRDRTLQVSRFLRLAAEVAGMDGVQQAAAVSGITRDQVVTMAKRAFSKVLSEDQIETGVTLEDITAFGRNEIGFAPYGTPVPGQAMAQRQVQADTPAFKAWFGDSKVVDENGKPLVVYHGTTKIFTEFKEKEGTKSPSKLIGHFFSPSAEMASDHVSRRTEENLDAAIMPVYLSITNPYTESVMDHMDMNTWSPSKIKKWKQDLRDKGYDGIYIKPSKMPGYEDGVWVAFDPPQIKSATGNVGTFDPNNPSILMQEVANPQQHSTQISAELEKELDAGEKVSLYRAMMLIDGKLYPPMSGKVADESGKARMREPEPIGKWMRSQERPDLIPTSGKNAGKFLLKKAEGGGSDVWVTYAPYFHSSPIPLNDQFSAAWLNDGIERPQIVTVEIEVPRSELTSGYQADKSPKKVGANTWNAGVVASKIPGGRKVVLSRYARIKRIVPDAEVAEKIAEIVNPARLSIPENVVTPQLLAELKKNNVRIAPAGASGDDIFYQEQKNEPARLSVLHNLSAENLVYAEKIGGLAAPSLAIVKEGMGLSGFGEITLIGTKDLIDPSSVDVYDADAYTPRFPKPEYKPAKRSVAEKLTKEIKPFSDAFASRSAIDSVWDNAINKALPDRLIRDFVSSNAVKAMFLKEVGIESSPVESVVRPRWEWSYGRAWMDFAKNANHELGNLAWDNPARKQYMKDAGAAAINSMREQLESSPGLKYRSQELAEDLIDYGRKQFLNEDGEIKSGYLDIALRDAKSKGKKEIDAEKTAAKLNKLLKGKERDFQQWVESKVLSLYEKPFLRIGKEKVPYDLQGVVEKMTRGGVLAKEETMAFGEGKARAFAASRLDSVQHIKNKSWSIGDKSVVSESREKAKKALDEWRDSVVGYYKYSDTFEALDGSTRAIAKWAKGRSLESALKSEGFIGVPKSLIDKGVQAGKMLLDSPVPYFEAKPPRAVKIAEFAGAVIPKNSPKEVVEILNKNGVPFVTYSERLGDEAREKAVRSLRKKLAKTNESVLFQNQQQGRVVKGWTNFISAHRALIGATNKADFSTFIHEFFHPMRLFLLDKSVPAEKRADITDEEIETLEKYSGVKNGVWTVEAEEKAAKMWEQYWYEGISPNSVLDSLFQKISRWMREIYSGIQEITGTPLPKEIRDLFDKLVQRGLPADQRGGKGGSPVSKGEPVLRPANPITSIQNEVANYMALLRGSPGLVEPESETMDEWLEEAGHRLRQDPTLGDRLVKELDDNLRAPDPIEVAVLQMHFRGLENARKAAEDRLFAARDRNDEVAAAKAMRAVDLVVNAMEEMDQVDKKIGTLQARAFVARKITLRSDFTRDALLRRGRAANGGYKLDREQTKQIEELAKQIAEVQGDLAKAEQLVADLQRQLALRQSVDDEIKQTKPRKQDTTRQKATTAVKSFVQKFSSIFKPKDDKTDTLMQSEDELMAQEAENVVKAYVEAGVYSYGELMANLRKDIGGAIPDEARTAFAKAWQRIKAQGEIPVPEIDTADASSLTKIARDIQRSLLEAGIVDEQDPKRADIVLEAVWESLREMDPDITERQTIDALSGYGQFTPLDPDEIKKMQRDINGQLLQLAKKRDLESGVRPKATGAERREMSPEERQLLREVNELKRTSKLYTEDRQGLLKSSISAALRATRNRIIDLRKAMAEGKPIVKTQVDLASQDEELAKQRKLLAEVLKEYRDMFPRPGATDAQRLAAALRATEREIARIEEQIRTKDFSPKGKAEPVTSAELRAKQAELEAVRARRDAIRAIEDPDYENRRAELALIANLKARYAEYEDRKAKGYFGPKPKKAPLQSDEITKHRRRLEEKKEEFFRLAAQWRLSKLSPKERVFDWARETSFLARAIMTSMDLSAVFRQGGPGTFAHPMLAREAAKEMRRAIFSQEVEFDIAEQMSKHRLYSFAVQAKLEVTASAGRIQNQEEAYMGRWARDGIGKKGTKINKFSRAVLIPVAASARAYTTYLNGLRFRLFVYFVDTLGANGQVTLDEAKAIANFINISTGRGNFGSFNKVAANLSTVLFAPRYLVSRFAYLGLPFYMLQDAKVSGRVKRLIAMEYARHALGVAGFLATAVALGGLLYDDDDEESPTVELDPRSTDFMKLKIGETRIDPLSGFGQIVTFMSQVGVGQKKTMEGEIVDIRGENKKYGQDSTFDLAANFLRKKLAPIPAAGVNVINGEDVVGNKATVATATTGLFIPLAGREVVETLMARGVPEGPAIAMLNILGMSGGTYGPKTKFKNANADERAKLIDKDLEAMEWNSRDPAYKDFLTIDQLERFRQRREQRKQSLVYAASANPKRKDFQDDATYAKAVAERDKALNAMIEGKIGEEEARMLLLAYWRRNNKTLYERKGQGVVMKDALLERLRQITRKLNQK